MDWIRQYLLSVTAAALICSVVVNLIGKKGTGAVMIKLLCGMFMSITMLSPLLRNRLPDISGYFDTMAADGTAAAVQGRQSAKDAMSAIIKEKTEAYILDKASSMDLNLRAEVIVTDVNMPYPSHVRIQGSAAPYSRQQLQLWIEENLGILKENQSWI